MSMGRHLDRLSNKIYRTPSGPQVYGQKYAYVYAITNKGRHIFDGPYPVAIGSDEPPVEAEAFLSEFPNGEVFILKTRNKARAKQEVKHILASRGDDPDEVLKRMFKKREVDLSVKPKKEKKQYTF